MVNLLPTETKSGMFEGRETRLGPCECGNGYCTQPTSFFVDTGETCPQQTIILRRLPSADEYAKAHLPMRLAALRKDEFFVLLEEKLGWELAMYVYG